MAAHDCSHHLQEPCTDYDGVSEKRCYHRIHTGNFNKTDYEKKDQAQGSHSGFAKDVMAYKACLIGVKRKTDACLPNLAETCNRKKIHATKVIRLRVQTVKYLLQRNPFVKIIHYIRDPRGVLDSRSKHVHLKDEEEKANYFVHNAISLCTKIHRDTQEYQQLAKQYPDNFMKLRYEDLVGNTNEKLQEIYDFIEEELPAYVISFFKKSLHGNVEGPAMATIRKNGSATAMQWQTTLDAETIEIVNRICEDALRDIAYT